MSELNCKPFVKWAGGKTQIIDELLKRVPKSFKTYFEPFLGGGALLFAILPHRAFCGDLNSELINAYDVLKDEEQKNNLIWYLQQMEKDHSEEFFYQVRQMDREFGWRKTRKESPALAAARFIYLNKAGFNGLYRVNKRGYFNVPYGKRQNLNTYDARNLADINNYFSNNKIFFLNTGFKGTLEYAKEGDFVYLDPPYDNSWSDYTSEGFSQEDQFELKEELDRLNNKGVKWMYSNNDTEFIRDLFTEYNIEEIQTRRSINRDGTNRNNGKELIIRNYKD